MVALLLGQPGGWWAIVTDGDLIREIFAPLGVAVPLVLVLFYLLRQATEERRSINTEYLRTMREMVSANAQGNERVAGALNELAEADRERKLAATAEHERMIRELDRIGSEMARWASLMSSKTPTTRRGVGQ